LTNIIIPEPILLDELDKRGWEFEPRTAIEAAIENGFISVDFTTPAPEKEMFMENDTHIVLGGRSSGKTTALIKHSHNTGAYIVCHSREEAQRIFAQAADMGLQIPLPLSFSELINGRFAARGISGFVIDNADDLIQFIAGRVGVEAISISSSRYDFMEPPV